MDTLTTDGRRFADASLGPPKLMTIVQQALIKLKSCIGDIGIVPIELLDGLFAALTPSELATVEDLTQRDLSPCTWPLWWKHCTTGSLTTLVPIPDPLPRLPCVPESPMSLWQFKGLPTEPAHYR